jgi:hypothetical protein
MHKDISEAKFIIYFGKFLLIYYYISLLVRLPETLVDSGVSSIDISPPWFSVHINQVGMNNKLAGGRSSETYSHPHRHEHHPLTYIYEIATNNKATTCYPSLERQADLNNNILNCATAQTQNRLCWGITKPLTSFFPSEHCEVFKMLNRASPQVNQPLHFTSLHFTSQHLNRTVHCAVSQTDQLHLNHHSNDCHHLCWALLDVSDFRHTADRLRYTMNKLALQLRYANNERTKTQCSTY